MRKLVWFFGLFVAIVLVVLGYLFIFRGLGAYVRMNIAANRLPEKERQLAINELRGTNGRGAESGAYAGVWLDRVWVWTKDGLKSYLTDKYSVFSIFDGCSDDVRKAVRMGTKDAIRRTLFSDFGDWTMQAGIGEYVVVYRTKPDQGGTPGFLREIYLYNFWEFLPRGIDIQCAK